MVVVDVVGVVVAVDNDDDFLFLPCSRMFVFEGSLLEFVLVVAVKKHDLSSSKDNNNRLQQMPQTMLMMIAT